MSDRNSYPQIARLLGWIGLILGLLLMPPVFGRTLAMGELLPSQIWQLWLACGAVVLAALRLILRPRTIDPRVVALIFVALLFGSCELAARSYFVAARPGLLPELARLSVGSYPGLTGYQGHPFAQFTGRPSITLIGNRTLGSQTPFNNFGFHGADFAYDKPPGTVRIAALGGSTTATGYPAVLEERLNERPGPSVARFEALNFGHGWYTSAHLVANFILTAVDFQPDYVIVHSGWNDRIARNAPGEFRGDYSHALKAFELPFLPDKYMLRVSALYRHLKNQVMRQPYWYLSSAIIRHERTQLEDPWDDLDELRPFRRNIRTIVEVALSRGMRVVLTTQPRSTDPGIRRFGHAEHIDQCNAIMRELAEEFGHDVLFVDLDEVMTGVRNDLFTDLAHVTTEGRTLKAERFADAIRADLETRRVEPRTDAPSTDAATTRSMRAGDPE